MMHGSWAFMRIAPTEYQSIMGDASYKVLSTVTIDNSAGLCPPHAIKLHTSKLARVSLTLRTISFCDSEPCTHASGRQLLNNSSTHCARE
jgi:hypothetical protein